MPPLFFTLAEDVRWAIMQRTVERSSSVPRHLMPTQSLTFWVWVLLLAALLFYPVSKLIWVFSVRRLQRKLQRELSQEELQGQLQRARFLAVLLVLLFSWLYNFNTIGPPGHG